jgi:hypothetical protein
MEVQGGQDSLLTARSFQGELLIVEKRNNWRTTSEKILLGGEIFF